MVFHPRLLVTACSCHSPGSLVRPLLPDAGGAPTVNALVFTFPKQRGVQAVMLQDFGVMGTVASEEC